MLKLEHIRIDNGGFILTADFAIPPGARVAVIGPSGAGKTTLIEAVAGYLPLSCGRILWGESDISDQLPGKRPVAMLFQDGNLFPHLTAAQNVGLGLQPNLRLSDSEHARVAQALGEPRQVGTLAGALAAFQRDKTPAHGCGSGLER